MARKEVYVLIPTLWARVQAQAKPSQPTPHADKSSKRGKRKLASAQPSRRSKRLKSESPQALTDFGKTQPVKVEEESDEALPKNPETLPTSTPQSPSKLIIRLPRRKFSSFSEFSEYEDAQPGRPETPSASSGTRDRNGSIRRVHLIVRPPRSPTPSLDQDDDTLSSGSSSQMSDTESIQTDSHNLDSPFITRSWLGGDVFDSPTPSEFGTDMKQEPTENLAFMHKKRQRDPIELSLSPSSPITAAPDRSLSPSASAADRVSPPSSTSSAQSTLDLAHGSVSTESDIDSDFEGELMYPEYTTPPSSPKVQRIVQWFDFEKYGNMIPGC